MSHGLNGTKYRRWNMGVTITVLLGLNAIAAPCGPLLIPDDEIDVPALFAAFRSSDPRQVSRADRQFYAVQRWPTSAVPFLVAELSRQPTHSVYPLHSNETTADYAAEALVKIGKAAASALANVAVQNADTDSRIRAFNALARIGVDANESIPALLVCTHDQDQDIRYFAVETLVRVMRTPAEILATLIQCLDDSFADVQGAAVRGLGTIGPPAKAAVPKLRDMLSTQEHRREDRFSFVPLRADVAEALGRIGVRDAETTARCEVLLADEDALVRVAAALACWRLTDDCERTLGILKKELHDQSHPVRVTYAAVNALGEMGRHALPLGRELITLLKHSQAEVRWSAVNAIRCALPDEYPDHILPLLQDESSVVRETVIKTLGADDANNVRYIDSIIAALDDHDPCVQRTALDVLYRMRGRAQKAIPRLEIMSASDVAAEHDYAQEVLMAIRGACVPDPASTSGKGRQ